MIEAINARVRAANSTFLPFKIYAALCVGGGLAGGFVILPWLAETFWQLSPKWGLDGYGWFVGASVAFVSFLFAAVNLFLRMLDCDALEVTLPTRPAFLRRVRRPALAWCGLVPIAIGLVIGKTIFT